MNPTQQLSNCFQIERLGKFNSFTNHAVNKSYTLNREYIVVL